MMIIPNFIAIKTYRQNLHGRLLKIEKTITYSAIDICLVTRLKVGVACASSWYVHQPLTLYTVMYVHCTPPPSCSHHMCSIFPFVFSGYADILKLHKSKMCVFSFSFFLFCIFSFNENYARPFVYISTVDQKLISGDKGAFLSSAT